LYDITSNAAAAGAGRGVAFAVGFGVALGAGFGVGFGLAAGLGRGVASAAGICAAAGVGDVATEATVVSPLAAGTGPPPLHPASPTASAAASGRRIPCLTSAR
jgi:hypothetical protein